MSSRGNDASSAAQRRGEASLLTIQQVSRVLDVPTPTIRSWERRYGLPQAVRTPAGHRRYSHVQVQALRRMRDAIVRGEGAAEAANLARTTQMRTQAAQPLIDALLQGSQQLDPRQISNTLDAARATLGLDAAIDDVLLPAMRQIGRDWQDARCSVAHEHLSTETTRAWLTRVAVDEASGPAREDRRPIILTCGPDDHHTLGLEAIAALLRHRGADCRLLGASVPTDSLSEVIERTRPAAVVLVSHLSVARKAAVDALHASAAAFEAAELPQARLFYAGNAFVSSGSRRGVAGTYLGEDLSRAADLISTATSEGQDG